MVAAMGACGALARYAIALAMLRLAGGPTLSFVGTIVVNAVGSFLFGYLFAAGPHISWLTPALRLGLLTGFMGAFTTFSAFSMDTIQLFQTRGPSWAVAYVVVQNVLGIGLALVGAYLGRLL